MGGENIISLKLEPDENGEVYASPNDSTPFVFTCNDKCKDGYDNT